MRGATTSGAGGRPPAPGSTSHAGDGSTDSTRWWPDTAHVLRSVRAVVVARALAVPWAVAIILGHQFPPYPPGVRTAKLTAVAVLAAANLAIWIALRTRHRRVVAVTALAGLILDVAVVGTVVWLHAFDPTSALWALLFILPLEGAILLSLPGALVTWTATAGLYAAREVWGSATYGYVLSWHSVAFRMGIGLLIALVAGLMARDLLRQRARLTAALSAARKAEGLRDRLVSMLAHDIRTPLTVIRQAIATMDRLDEHASPAMRRRVLEVADRHADRLERLATGLLDLARSEAGALHLDLSPTDVPATVTDALEFVRDGDRVHADVPSGLTVAADRDRLEQVLVNLIGNALRHGAPPVRVEATTGSGTVRISVIDHGPGLPDDVEDPFAAFQAGAANGSVGYGLRIAQQLVAAHGGELAYHREDGQTRLTFELPAVHPSWQEDPQEQPGPARLDAHRMA